MADEKGQPTREEVDIDKTLRTADDKVFFQGKAHVDERTAESIEAAEQEAKARKTRAMEIEGEEEDEDEDEGKTKNELGDTRTSKATKRASKKARKGRGR